MLGLLGGNVTGQGAVARFQIGACDAIDILDGDRRNAVALQEIQAPVASGDRFGQRHRDTVDVGEVALVHIADALLGLCHLVFGDRRGGDDVFGLSQQFGFGLGDVDAFGRDQDQIDHAAIAQVIVAAAGEGGQLGLDQRFVQAAGRRVADRVDQHRQCSAVRMGDTRGVISERDQVCVAGATHVDFAFAVLTGFDRVQLRQRGCRPQALSEMTLDGAQRSSGIDTARNDQRRVVGPIPAAVKRLQPLDRHVLHVGTRADRAVAVVVPQIGGGAQTLEHHLPGVVFVALHLVADHGHFAVEVFLGDQRIDHPVGFQAEQPVQRLVVGGERAVVIGAVERCGCVLFDAAFFHFAGNVGVRRRALEQHVLQ